MKNPLNNSDDKFVNSVSTPTGRIKMIAILERSRIASFCAFFFILVCTVLIEILGGNIGLTGLCGMIFAITFISTDNQIKWLKSVNHEQMINRKEKA
jgi:hypothetical protein